MEIYNLDNPAYLEAKGLAKVWKAYYKNAKLDNWSTNREEIMEVGFNQNSGYVYIALENGISIASAFGQSVEYIVTNMDNGEEYFLDSYSEAENKLKELYETY
tara:strand:+ start:657 stop:965 length:309 start_codon:yes stop_codon:yes gene_type:complete